MALLVVTVLARILEAMFAIGIIGSTLVLILTAIEDFRMLFGREDESHS